MPQKLNKKNPKKLSKKRKPFQIMTVEATEKNPKLIFVARFEGAYEAKQYE